ncbi:MAG: isochorismatase family protein [Gammaproteobacteria bacterium]
MEASQPHLTVADHDGLLIIDVQNDFLPGGSLAVPGGDQIIPVLNGYIILFRKRHLPVFATRDWHPPDHCSFQSQGGPWPVHCVRSTKGADFPETLALPAETIIISKGERQDRDAYSGFQDTDLHEQLQQLGVRRLFIGGLATDYCVQATVLDALQLGYAVCLLEDAIRAVDVKPGDGEQALATMAAAGAVPLSRECLR